MTLLFGHTLRKCLFSADSKKNLLKNSYFHFYKKRKEPKRLLFARNKPYSTASLTPNVAAISTPSEVKSSEVKEGFFSRNLGTIFGCVVLGIAGYFYRVVQNNRSRDELVAQIEESCGIEPFEIEDMRSANREFSAEVFADIVRKAQEAFPSGMATYSAFVAFVAAQLGRTLQQGYLLDRVVIKHLVNNQNCSTYGVQEGDTNSVLPLPFLLVALSLATCTSVDERVKIYHHLMSQSNPTEISFTEAATLIEDLKNTCQIPAEKHVHHADVKYPFQKYRLATGEEMLKASLQELKLENTQSFSIHQLLDVLQSRAVCAWGECFSRKRNL